jgi:hypothetical protein
MCGPASGFVSGLVSVAGAQTLSRPELGALVREASAVMSENWLQVPVGPDAERWVTTRTQRTVVAVVHTVAGAGHLLDAVELLEHDPRVQVVFTQAPDVLSNGVPALLRGLNAVVVPWHQATRSRFDLAVATDSAGVHELHAPLLFLPHGVMNNKRAPAGLSGPDSDLVVGLAAPWLTWYGRLVPAVVALSHVDLLGVLSRQCPQALPAARVVGDLCLDRLVASRTVRARYRDALGVAEGQTVVAVSSTWGPQSLFARFPALLGDLRSALCGDRYVVAVGMHSAVWFGHGPRQVLAWLRDQRRGGLLVVDPDCWRGLVAAADVVVGDHGSATVYAAAAGVPVLRAPWAPDSVGVGSAVAALAEVAPMVTNAEPLPYQLDTAAAAFADEAGRTVAARVTSQPDQAARLLRTQMYRLLELAEPSGVAETAPVGVARLVGERGV